eukprot:761841-Hanusia_phi.AAC.5
MKKKQASRGSTSRTHASGRAGACAAPSHAACTRPTPGVHRALRPLAAVGLSDPMRTVAPSLSRPQVPSSEWQGNHPTPARLILPPSRLKPARCPNLPSLTPLKAARPPPPLSA